MDILSEILNANGITDPFERDVILSGSESTGSAGQFFDSSILGQMIDDAKKIVVHTDYDVDGISSAAIARQYIPECEVVVPSREDGYGIKRDFVESLDPGTLLVTADCGIRSGDILDNAPDGVSVVVTDHHEPNIHMLSKKWPVANPLLVPGSFRGYSGSGVLYLILKELYGGNDYASQFAALGTICDVMPMRGHNRRIVKDGILSMQENPFPGILALCKKSGVYCREITEEDIGWKIGPAINASSRMGRVEVASKLFTDPFANHDNLSSALVKMNKERKALVDEIYDSAEIKAAGDIRYVVLSDIRAGMIGLVAGKIKRDTGMSGVAIVNRDDGVSSASMRSMASLNAVGSLSGCHDLLLSYGGHVGAAGFSFMTRDIDSVLECMKNYADSVVKKVDISNVQKHIAIDVNDAVSSYGEIRRIAPYGHGFPNPAFVSNNILSHARNIGDGSHLKFKFGKHDAVLFGFNAPAEDVNNSFATILYTLSNNRYAGKSSIQLMVQKIL